MIEDESAKHGELLSFEKNKDAFEHKKKEQKLKAMQDAFKAALPLSKSSKKHKGKKKKRKK